MLSPVLFLKIPISHSGSQKWFLSYYLLINSSKGISSVELSKKLNITQKASWFILHRLRELTKGDFITLKRDIEIDETYIGGKKAINTLAKTGELVLFGMIFGKERF